MPLPNDQIAQRVALAHSGGPISQGNYEPSPLLVDRSTGRLMVQTDGFLRPAHDYRSFEYDIAKNVKEITYRLGGASGVIVGVETLTYDGDGDVLTQSIVLT
jgi:hypothetical protein